MTEAYNGDSLVGVVESDSRGVRVGETQELVAFFTPPSEGKYRLVSKVEYSGQETGTTETTVIVGDFVETPVAVEETFAEAATTGESSVALSVGVITTLFALVILVIVLTIFLIRKAK